MGEWKYFSGLRHIAEEAKHCDLLILWLDCDRQGPQVKGKLSKANGQRLGAKAQEKQRF